MRAEEGARLYNRNGHPYSSTPHAVVVPWPGQGHINPLLHLSKRLASQYGFSITFVNLDFTHSRVMSAVHRQEEEELADGHINTSLSPRKLDIKFVSLSDGVPAEDTRTGNVPALCRGVVHSSSDFERLLAELRPPPTCVISDVFVLHTQDAANKFNIPRVGFWTQSVASFAAHLAAARGLIPSHDDGEGKLIRNIVGAPPLRLKDLPGFLQTNHKETDFLFEFSTRPFTRLEEAHCVLMNSFEALEGGALEVVRQQVPGCKFWTIGPVLPVDYFSGMKLSKSALNKAPGFWAEDYSCLQWLDTQREASVLYVSFGSITELTEEELQAFALGLQATCLPILWVVRPGVLEGGRHASLPRGIKDRNDGRVLIINWAPQLHVLAHPAVGAFVTHGGWNSTLEGVSQGKPLLGFPYFADQMLNCRCIEDLWGNGLALERHGEGLLTRTLVESKVRALMSDNRLRETAILLRDGARHAVLSKEEGSSASNLSKFINSLMSL